MKVNLLTPTNQMARYFRHKLAIAIFVAVAVHIAPIAKAQQETQPVRFTDIRDMRFCEILVVKGDMVDIYNTSASNEDFPVPQLQEHIRKT